MQVGSLICGEKRFLGGVFQRGVVRCGEEREKRKELSILLLPGRER